MEGEQNREKNTTEKKRVTPRKGPSAKRNLQDRLEQEIYIQGETEQTATAAAVKQGRWKKKKKKKEKPNTLTPPPLCLFFRFFRTLVCREAPQRQVCVSAPATADPSPSGLPSWSLCSLGLSETGRASPHSPAHRGRTYRRGSLPGLGLRWTGWDKKNNSERWHGMDEDAKCRWIRIILFSCSNILIDWLLSRFLQIHDDNIYNRFIPNKLQKAHHDWTSSQQSSLP